MSTNTLSKSAATLLPDEMLSQVDNMMKEYWKSNPDLQKIVEEKRELAEVTSKLWNVKDLPPQPI
jgi:hypothetical protein